MSNESAITRSIWPLICQNPKLAGHVFCGPVSADAQVTLETLQEELDDLDSAFWVVESVTEFTEHYSQIEELRGKIGYVKDGISNLDTYASVYQDASSLIKAIRRIKGLGPNPDPIVAARAWGAAMTSFGKLVEKLPPPADAAGSIIAEMGRIFAKVVADLVYHTRGNVSKEVDRLRSVYDGKSVLD